MKKVNGFIWTEERKDGTVNVGFTRAFIDWALMECFHVTQAASMMVVENKPLLTIETTCGLKVIRCPVTGIVSYFNTKARDFPDKLTEEDVIVTIRPKSVKTSAKTVKEKTDAFRQEDVAVMPNWVVQDDVAADDRLAEAMQELQRRARAIANANRIRVRGLDFE